MAFAGTAIAASGYDAYSAYKAGGLSAAGKSIARDTAISAAFGGAGKLVSKGYAAFKGVGKAVDTAAHSAGNAAKLNRQLVLDEVVGHSFEKHVLKHGEFNGLGIRTKSQFRNHASEVLDNPSSIRYYKDGRTAYLHESSGSILFRNPNSSGQSTLFQPRSWTGYINNITSRTLPYK